MQCAVRYSGKIKMTNYIKNLHTTLFTGPTDFRKYHFDLELIEKEYNEHFDYIIIICPTLWWKKTYPTECWVKHNCNVWPIKPKDKLYHSHKKRKDSHSPFLMIMAVSMVVKFSKLLTGWKTTFIINDITTDESWWKLWSILES